MAGNKEKVSKKEFSCPYEECKWVFACNYKLQRHIKSHTKVKPFHCQQCKKTFSYEYNLKVHLKSHSDESCAIAAQPTLVSVVVKNVENNLDLPLTCSYKRCIKRFQNKTELEEHLSTHKDKIGHKCDVPGCNKVFHRPSVLKHHILIHNGIYPFKCDVASCSKTFATAQNLKYHKLVHENKKEFKCDNNNCGKAFNTIENLRTHQRVHNSKKYICPIENCKKLFVCMQTLKVHIQGHNNVRKYVCNYESCNKSYLTSSNLKFHKKLHLLNKGGNKKCETTLSIQQQDIVQKETINVNDFINISLFEEKATGKVSTSNENQTYNQTLSREDLLAATFGEIACNEYINNEEGEPIGKSPSGFIDLRVDIGDDTVDKSFEDSPILQQNSKEKFFQATLIEDIQFQEEFPSNIYMPSVNNYRPFITGHDYEQSEYDTPSGLSMPSQDMNEVNELAESSGLAVVNDVDYISETSMELSTGHLEIDGGYFCSSLCLPDHVYSHQVS